MNLVLRKTVEGFSAGTMVVPQTPITEEDLREPLHESIAVAPLTGDTNYLFDVLVDDLVILKPRTVMIPANAGERKRKRKAARRDN